MKPGTIKWIPLFLLAIWGAVITGCHKQTPAETSASTISAALAQLAPEDRKLAEEQGYCANEPESPLGSMGVPIKLTVKDRPVFVCCEACSRSVLENPDKALATVDRLKAKVAAAKK